MSEGQQRGWSENMDIGGSKSVREEEKEKGTVQRRSAGRRYRKKITHE